MLEKKFAPCVKKKKINILTIVLSEKKIVNETKNHNPLPPFKLNGRSLTDGRKQRQPTHDTITYYVY